MPSWADETLRVHPPQADPPYIRIQALAATDDPLHLGEAPVLDAVADFFQSRGSDYDNWIKGIGKAHDVDALFINCRDGAMGRKYRRSIRNSLSQVTRMNSGTS
ncbi:MAG: hypothetical protein JSW47_09160 [Phycisphaerales bacterium]|nr:MAG: hypothetical protein JSW47_09160 [Phycisphaerales bacterium]